MILLITGAMTPAKNVTKTTLIDTNKRKDQYVDSIKKAIKQAARFNSNFNSVNENSIKNNISIVYCDNSEPKEVILEDLKRYAKGKNVKLETLSFKGNGELTAVKGKGYGEGEITKYAMENSALIKEDGYFIKLTGRLFIDNMSSLLKKLSQSKAYFNIPNHTMRGLCDTRLYAMPIELYKEYFLNAYENVNDDGGYYLEHAFTDVIRSNNIKTFNFPEYPLYSGKSGSAGADYTYVPWKSKIKNILSAFQFYKVK